MRIDQAPLLISPAKSPSDYAVARLLASHGSSPLGCVGVRRLSGLNCEMKRLYVRDRVRGGGCGRQLAAHSIECAQALGYERMMLDRLESMTAARRLYASLGLRNAARS